MDEETVRLIQDLVRIPSVNPRQTARAGERDVAEFVADWMRSIGCDVALQEVLPGRPNVVARLAGRKPGRALLLEAHLDTERIAATKLRLGLFPTPTPTPTPGSAPGAVLAAS